MIEIILALGLVITAATQLRAGGLPLGPGELVLLVWLCLAGLRQLLSRPLILNAALARVLSFWFVMVVCLCVGMTVGLLVEPFQDYGGMLRDTVAYAFVFSFSVMMAVTMLDAADRRQLSWSIVLIGSISLILQIGSGLGKVPMPGVDPWYWDRLRGWAENPNQLGFFALFIALLGLHLADQATTKIEALRALAAIAPAIVAGVMSRSDSFMIGIFVSGGLFVTLKSVSWLRDTEMAPTMRGAAVVLAILTLPLALLISVPFTSAALSRIENVSNQVYADNDQGDTRLHLWVEAIDKGIQSKLAGFGPGPHLTSKSFKRPPPDKFEVHNTLLDLLTQGGIVAMMAFVWISVTALLAAARAGHPALAGLVAGLLVFSMFHYALRQPIFWFGIVLCLLDMTGTVKSLPPRVPPRRAVQEDRGGRAYS
ncbi:MAG: O-antigen ligase protein [Cypionkella sp.]|nr:O-antigen ligase protein [Cypionkella sp.]